VALGDCRAEPLHPARGARAGGNEIADRGEANCGSYEPLNCRNRQISTFLARQTKTNKVAICSPTNKTEIFPAGIAPFAKNKYNEDC
jgi:hypothetical protein